MATLATGQRLRSMVCATEIMVIAAPDEDVELKCGGALMAENGDGSTGEVDAGFAEGTTIGKRYVNEGGSLEVLCVKPGDGSLSVGDTALTIKESKKLPKTD